MERLFLFIYQYRAFFTFLALEFFCAWLVVEYNQYQGAKFFNSSGSAVARLGGLSYGVKEYFSLREKNNQLAEENVALRDKLEKRNQSLYTLEMHEITDPAIINKFDFESAKVVNNTVSRITNFITINKGSDANIAPGMAVISSLGVVGKVKTVSRHFGVVTSLLNKDVMVSSIIKRTGHFGTVQWGGEDPEYVSLKFIPRHVKPVVGDSVVTSGYNAVFPENIPIGIIAEVELGEEELFYELKVKLSQDFRKLSYVAVIRSNLKTEQDSLELPFTENESR
jgi:rod shape-determining protein MreC